MKTIDYPKALAELQAIEAEFDTQEQHEPKFRKKLMTVWFIAVGASISGFLLSYYTESTVYSYLSVFLSGSSIVATVWMLIQIGKSMKSQRRISNRFEEWRKTYGNSID